MFVLEIAHAHTTCDIACDMVLKQLNVWNFFCFGKEEFYFAFGCSEFLVRSEASQIFGDDVVISEAHVDCTVFFGNELQKFHIGKIVVCYVTCDTTDVRRQEILLEENFKMLAQDANRAGHRSIEIDMQIADEKVVHALNLYSRLVTVKGWIARRFSLKCGD